MRTRLALLLVAALPAPGAAAAPQMTGPLVALSAKDASLQDFPRVAGTAVYAIAQDGNGGWFVGGTFSSIGGVGCRNLAHVRGDATVDGAWCPRPNGTVRALARSGNVLYVGGLGISRIGGAVRSGLAALDVRTGRATAWSPGPISRIGEVLQLTIDPARRQLLVAGEFSRLGGRPREWLGAVGLGTARATPFAPEPDATAHGDSVIGTVVAAGSIYAWGFFSRIGGLPRDAFARLHPVTGKALRTVVSPICPTALLAVGRRLYAGTDLSCEGVKQPLLELGLPDLRPIPWHPAVLRRHVEALASAQDLVVAAAANDHFSATEPRLVVGLDPRGRRAFTSPVHPIGAVEAVQASGTLILVGGLFRSVAG